MRLLDEVMEAPFSLLDSFWRAETDFLPLLFLFIDVTAALEESENNGDMGFLVF